MCSIYVQTQSLVPETSSTGFICLEQFSALANKQWLRLKTIASTRPKDYHAVKYWAFSFLFFYALVLPAGFTCCRRVIVLQLNYSCYQRHLSCSYGTTCRSRHVKLCVSSCFSSETLQRLTPSHHDCSPQSVAAGWPPIFMLQQIKVLSKGSGSLL